jgi:hypothetical protein
MYVEHPNPPFTCRQPVPTVQLTAVDEYTKLIHAIARFPDINIYYTDTNVAPKTRHDSARGIIPPCPYPPAAAATASPAALSLAGALRGLGTLWRLRQLRHESRELIPSPQVAQRDLEFEAELAFEGDLLTAFTPPSSLIPSAFPY